MICDRCFGAGTDGPVLSSLFCSVLASIVRILCDSEMLKKKGTGVANPLGENKRNHIHSWRERT